MPRAALPAGCWCRRGIRADDFTGIDAIEKQFGCDGDVAHRALRLPAKDELCALYKTIAVHVTGSDAHPMTEMSGNEVARSFIAPDPLYIREARPQRRTRLGWLGSVGEKIIGADLQ